MTVRAIETEVQDMLDDSTHTFSVTLFIAQANVVVNELLAPSGSSVLSDDRLKLIETYIAAHFATLVRERGGMQEDKLGDALQRYHNIYKAGFSSTRFGQQALFLDTTGKLAAIDAGVQSPNLPALFETVTSKNYDAWPSW